MTERPLTLDERFQRSFAAITASRRLLGQADIALDPRLWEPLRSPPPGPIANDTPSASHELRPERRAL